MNIDSIRNAAFIDELEKISQEDSVKNTSWGKGMLGTIRAGTIGDKARYLFKKPELMGDQLVEGLKGAGVGAAYGAGAGAIAHGAAMLASRRYRSAGVKGLLASAGLTSLMGAGLGGSAGSLEGEKKFLAKKGITFKGGVWTPKHSFNFTDEAKKKYRV